MINITAMSDSHDKHSLLEIGSGDLIIHAGDCTGRGNRSDIEEFLRWYGDLNFDMKILIAGNHDFDFERNPELCAELCKNYGVTLLNDSGVKFKGLNIWGSPVQPWFHNWAFNRMRTKEQGTAQHPYIGYHWDKIPSNTDILITHSPPEGILDKTADRYNRSGDNIGCSELLKKVQEIKPVLHIFGHIHEARGVEVHQNTSGHTTYCNASSLDLTYRLYKVKTFRFDWDNLLTGRSRGED